MVSVAIMSIMMSVIMLNVGVPFQVRKHFENTHTLPKLGIAAQCKIKQCFLL
jgi:hypothetical protein